MDLERLRRDIDIIDEKIQSLITERAKIVQEISILKKTLQENFYQPQREKEILEKVEVRHQGPLSKDQMIKIFQEILSMCLSLEKVSHEQNRTRMPCGELASTEISCG